MKLKFVLSTVITISTCLVIISCKSDNSANDHGHIHEHAPTVNSGDSNLKEEDHHDEGVIHLTDKQIKTIGLSFGTLSEIKVSDYIKSTGTLGLPPEAYSSVSAKAEGHIKNAKTYVEGSTVKSGAIIAYLENPQLIEKQELYFSTHAELNYLEKQYQRQKSLFEQNAGVEKDVQKLYSELQMKKAQKLSAENYLDYLGINKQNVLEGKFIKRIPIKAPINGFITSIDMHNGMFVTPDQQLLEIVSDDHLHLELDVFENDIAEIEIDQKITYKVLALGNQSYEGEVFVIGKEFDAHNKTVRVHGHLIGERPKFIKDLFITAKIWLNDKKVEALPEEAIMKDGASSFLYYSRSGKLNDHGEMEFEKLMVLPGFVDEGFVSVKLLEELPDGAQIVIKGAYFLYAQSKYGEATHDH